MNAIRSIERCAKHQDVTEPYIFMPIPEMFEDNKWIAERTLEQQSLPEPRDDEAMVP